MRSNPFCLHNHSQMTMLRSQLVGMISNIHEWPLELRKDNMNNTFYWRLYGIRRIKTHHEFILVVLKIIRHKTNNGIQFKTKTFMRGKSTST